MQPINRPSIEKCIDVFCANDGKIDHFILLSSGFRNAKNLKKHLLILKKEVNFATVNNICVLIDIFLRTYCNVLKDKQPYDHKNLPPPSHQLLTESEEEKLNMEIERRQIENDWVTGSYIRELVESLFKECTGITKMFSRDWCHDFKQRHSNEIDKCNANYVDGKRASINSEHIENYIKLIEKILADPPPPCLILNFDETFFAKRPEKSKRKSIFIKKSCTLKPHWRINSEILHMSLIATITSTCNTLRPLCLSTRKKWIWT